MTQGLHRALISSAHQLITYRAIRCCFLLLTPLFLWLFAINSWGQTTIGFQGGTGDAGSCWTYTNPTQILNNNRVIVGSVALGARSGSNSIRAGGGTGEPASCTSGGQHSWSTGLTASLACASSDASGCAQNGGTITFNNFSVVGYKGLQLRAFTRTHGCSNGTGLTACCGSGSGFDSGENLLYQVALDGGGFTTQQTVSGGSDAEWGYASANGQFTYTVPNCTKRIRFQTTVNFNRADEVYYLDDVELRFTGSPVGNDVTASASTICAGNNVTITACQDVNGDGWSYQWQKSTDGGVTWTNVGTNNYQFTESLTVTTQYRVTYTPPNNVSGCTGLPSATSAAITVTVNPAPAFTSITASSPNCVGGTLQLNINGCTNCNNFNWTGPSRNPSGIVNPTLTNLTLADAGTYNVTITSTNGCTTTGNVSITVNANPTITANSNSPVCEGQTINLTSTCATCTGFSWSGPGGFTDNVQNPTRSNATPAMSSTYTVTGTDANGCTNTATVSVTVNASIAMTAGSNSPICVGATLNLTSTPNGLTSYSWSGPGGFTANVQNPSRSNVILTHAGTYTVTGTNAQGCTGTASVTVVINDVPTITANSNNPVCEGQTINLTSTCATCTGFNWSGPGGFTDNVQNPTRTNATPAMSGTYTVTGTDANGCTNTATVSVTVNNVPAFTVASNAPLCVGQTLNLNLNGCTNCNTFNWTGANGFSSTLQNPILPTVQVINSGIYTVTVTSLSGCTTSASISVTVNPLPTPTAGAVVNPICEGSNLALTVDPYTSYNWVGPNGFTSTLQNPTLFNITLADAGVYAVAVTDANGCTGSSSVTVTVSPLPTTPNPNGLTTICRGQNANYSTPLQPGVTYNWSVSPAGPTILPLTPGADRVRVTWNAPAGTYTLSVQAGLAGCLSPIRTLTVTVNDVPVQPGVISGVTSVCPGGAGSYSILTIPNTLNYTWSVSPPVGATFLSPQGTENMNIGWNVPGTYTVSVFGTNACGNGITQTQTVTVNPIPNSATFINSTTPVCPGQTNTVYEVNNMPGTTYNWVTPAGTNITSGQGTSRITLDWVSVTAGNYTISVTPTRLGCTGSASTTTVVVNDPPPAQPGLISGNISVCAGNLEGYSIAIVPTATSYNWFGLPPGASIVFGQNTTNVTVDWGTLPTGTYTLNVTASNACGTSPTRTLSVNVVAIPAQPGTIVLPPFHCVGTTRTYSISPVAGATSYTWTNSCGWTGNSTTNTIDYIADSNSPCTITVTANNQCGSSPTSTTQAVSINIPTQPTPIIGANEVCRGSVENYSVGTDAGTTFTWTITPFGGFVVAGQGTNNVTIDWAAAQAGVYTITVTPTNACGSGLPVTRTVTVLTLPNPPAPIIGATAVCVGQTQTYTTQNLQSTNYQWEITSAGPSLIQNGASATITWNQTGNFIVIVKPVNACGVGAQAAILVRVVGPPVVNAGANQVLCTPNTVLNGTPVGGTWSCVSCPGVTLQPIGQLAQVTGMIPGQTNIFQYTVVSGTCPPSSATIQVRNEGAVPGTITASAATACPGEVVTLNLSGTVGNVIRWEVSENGDAFLPINNTTTTLTYTVTTTAQFRAVVRLGGTCPVEYTAGRLVDVGGGVTAQVIPANLTTCNNTATLLGNDPPINATGSWSFISGPVTPMITANGSVAQVSDMTQAGTYVFRWTITRGNCPPSFAEVTVIRAVSAQAQAGTSRTICAETDITFTGNVVQGATPSWSLVTAPVVPTMNPIGNILQVSGITIPGTYVFHYTLTIAGCGSSSTEVFVRKENYNVSPNAGADQTVCVPNVSLAGNAPAPGVGNWTFIAGPMIPILTPNGRFLNVSNMNLAGDYIFRWNVSFGSCPNAYDEIIITRLTEDPTARVASNSVSVCDQTTTQLTGILPPNSTGNWSFISGPASANISTISGIGNVTNMLAEGNYIFRWTVTSRCGISSVDVTVSRSVTIPNGYAPAFAGADQWVCNNQSALVTGNPIPPGFTGTWAFISGPVPASITTFGTFGSISGMSVPGPYRFAWTLSKSGSACPPTTAVVTITRVAPPTIAQGSAPANICGTTALLKGNQPLIGVGTWTFVAGPLVPNVNQQGTDALASGMTMPGVYRFRYTISSLPCQPSVVDVVINVNSGTVAGNLTGQTTVCANNNAGEVNLAGFTGTIVRWEISDNDFNSLTIVNNVTSKLFYNNLTRTTSYRAVVKQGSCPEEVSNIVTIVVRQSVAADAGQDQQLCGNSVTLNGNDPMGGTSEWTVLSAPTTPTITRFNNSMIATNMAAGTYVFSYAIQNDPCPLSTDQVTVVVSPSSVGGTITGSRTDCGSGTGILTLTGFMGTVVGWESSIDNFATAQAINNPNPTLAYVNVTQTTAYRAIVKFGNCAPETSSVAVVEVRQPTVANAGADQTVCAGTFTLRGNTPINGTGTWSLVQGPSVPTISQNGTDAMVSNVINGQYIFRYRIAQAPCASSQDEVRIQVSNESVAGVVSRDETICAGPNQNTLVLTGYQGTIVRWETSTDNWQTVIQHNNPTAQYTYFNLTVPTQFRAVVKSGDCPEKTSVHATVVVNQPPTPADPGTDRTLCGNSITIDGNVPQFGTPFWRFLSGPINPQLNSAGNRAIINGLNVSGVYVFQYSIENLPCPTSSKNIQIFVQSAPHAGTVIGNATVCAGNNNGVLQLTNNGGTVVRWEASTDNFVNDIQIININQTIITYTNLTMTTTFRAAVNGGSCGLIYGMPATVTVNPAGNAGIITGTSQVCSGTNNGSLVLSGYTGNVVRWEVFDGLNFSPIIVTSNTLNFINLTQNTTYRAVVRNVPCNEIYSAPISVTVAPSVSGGTLNGGSTVCSGANGSLTLSGANGTLVRWESAADCQNFSPITGTPSVLTYTNLTQTTCYRALVQNGSCGTTYSTVARVTVSSGNAGVLSQDATVCSGSNVGTLTLSSRDGQVLNWESSKDCQNFSPIANTTDVLTYVNLTETTCFRVAVSSGGVQCPTLFTNTVRISVNPQPNGGNLSENQTVCTGNNTGILTLSGFSGSILRWESSTDGFQTVTTINHTNATLTFQNLPQTTGYRVIVGSGVCESVSSNTIIVIVNANGNAGTIIGTSTVCGIANGTLTLSGFSGTILRWEASTDNFVNDIRPINNNTSLLTYQNLMLTTRYRAVVNTGACGIVISQPAEIQVDQPAVAGNLSSPRTVCNGNNNGILNLSGFSGAIVRWESSTNNFANVTPISNTGSSLSYVNLTQSTQYRVVLIGEGVCPTVISNEVAITVLPALILQANATTGCSLTGSITAVATGGSGGYVYSITPNVAPPNNTGIFNSLTHGNYVISVVDASGCTVNQAVTVSNSLTPPTITSVANITTSSAVVSWGAILPNTTRYTFRYRMLGVQSWTVMNNLVNTSIVLSNLQHSTTYEIEISYTCISGQQSGFSTGLIRQFTTLGMGDCSSPTVPIPSGFFVDQVTNTTARANWNLVNGALGYIISYGPMSQNPNNWNQIIVCHPINSTVVTNLLPNTAYGMRVRTNCSNCITALNNTDRRSNFSFIANFNTPATRLAKVADNESLSVYPNPNKGQFSIKMLADEVQNASIELIDVNGKKVWNMSLSLQTGDNEIPITDQNISAGVYLLRVKIGETHKTLKIMVE